MAKLKGLRAAALLGMSTLLLGASLVSSAADTGRGRYIVEFKPGSAAEAGARSAISGAGGRVLLDLAEVSAVAVDLPHKAVAALQRSGHIASVSEDSPRYMYALVDPSGPPYQLGQGVPYGIKAVQADQLTDAFDGNRKICIIDSGIDAVHEDLAGNVLSGENLTTSGTWDTDEAHHGTHVAGTIAAVDQPNIGVVGINPHMKLNIRIEKVFDASGSAPTSTIIKAMLGCMKAKANIVTMSLGSSTSNALEAKVVTLMANRNMLLIAAAGNAGNNTLSFPAAYPEVVSVAAVDINNAHASFSQFNSDVELSGPGVSVYSTVPMGTGTTASLTVGATPFSVNGLVGSPLLSRTGALYNYGTGEVSDPGVAGKVCLIQRGNISFADKVTHCQNDGGIAAVIYNNAPGNFNGTLNGAITTIPSVSASDTDGATMLGMLGQSATVAVSASNYAFFDGTSMATPHVSGVAAEVWSYFPRCTAAQIRTSLDNSALDLGSAGRDDNFGFGLVQAKAAYDRIKAMGCGV